MGGDYITSMRKEQRRDVREANCGKFGQLPIRAQNTGAKWVESAVMGVRKSFIWGLLAALLPVAAGADHAYASKTGERVGVFEHASLNYRLDLSGEAYTYVNFSDKVPDASFAAIRFQPNAFSTVMSERVGQGVDVQRYADRAETSLIDSLQGRENTAYNSTENLGLTERAGIAVYQKAISATISGQPMQYVLSAVVDGERGYRLMTFGSDSQDAVRTEADKLLAAFSIPDRQANNDIPEVTRSWRDYPSGTFGYRFRAAARSWYEWSDLDETNEAADIGALSTMNYGSVVMPVCWQGPPPARNAVYRVMMQQFGEDYPSDFIASETDIEKDGAKGKLLVGYDDSDGTEYRYHQWVVANDDCAYVVAAWGPKDDHATVENINRIWSDFRLTGTASSLHGDYETGRERGINAYLLNAFGMHYYSARSYRDAYRFFAQANGIVADDEAYLTNALRALAGLDAYDEAYEWLQPRLAPFGDNQVVASWDAWLANQVGETEKALRIYGELFATDYRDDEDFSVYLGLLADAGRWDDVDQTYERYSEDGVSRQLRILKAQLLGRREQFDEALAVLDDLAEGRPLDAELAYERMSILDAMDNPAETLRIADTLIENGYASLQSYYYKGDAEYQLRSFKAAKASFEKALEFAPGNANIRGYLDAIDRMLGQGDVSTIRDEIAPVELPRALRKVFAANDAVTEQDGYGAEFLSRITGFHYDGGKQRTTTYFRKIRVNDDNGVSQYSTLEFDYDPSYERLFVNTLRVTDADGDVIAEGDPNSYYITSDEDGYEASTEKSVHLPVPGITPGVVIEAVVSKQTNVEDATFPLETVYMAGERPVLYSALFVTGKTERIRYESHQMPGPVKRGKALVWELQHPQPFRWEPLQPWYDQILPWVQLGTVGEDWRSVGNEYLEEIADKLDSSKVAERAQRLVEGIDGEARKIEVLSSWVQEEIHYEAIEFGRRAYIPKSARETVRDRYGDCKDHAVLLLAMLNAVGIDAHIALVNLQQKVLPELPNTDQFDHVIVAIPAPDGYRFIDTTDKDLRLGSLPPRSMAGNYALLLSSESELVQIPDYETALTGIAVDREVVPGDDGYMTITESARLSGYQGAELRGQLRSIEKSELRASLQRWVASRYADAELLDYFVENVFDAEYDLIVEIEYRLPLDVDGSFDLPAFLETYYLEYDRMSDRRFPFEFHYPLRVTARTSVKIPAGQRLGVSGEKPGVGESKFGQWQRRVEQNDDAIEISFDYVASDSRFEPEDYRAFSEFQRRAIDAIEQPLVLE